MKCSCQRSGFQKPPCCATCVFGECPGCTYPGDIDCKRHAPTRTTSDDYSRRMGRWPRVHREDWCGAYQYDPTTKVKHDAPWWRRKWWRLKDWWERRQSA